MANHILIGIGGTGYNVLRDFRKRLWTEVPDAKERRKLPVRFLYIDSDEKTTPAKLGGSSDLRVNGQDTAITPDEYLGIKNVDMNGVFNNLSAFPRLRHVVGNGTFLRSCLGEVGEAAGQKRRAGRILFAQNAHEYLNKLHTIVQEMNGTVGNASDLNIYIFAGLAGGTGSGSIVDAVAQLISDQQLTDAKVEVFAMLPEELAPSGADAGRYHANGYAALTELSALNAGVFLPADVVNGREHVVLNHPDFTKQFGLTVYTNKNRNGATVDSYTTMPELVANLMYFRVFTPHTQDMDILDRHFRSENRPDFQVEYSTKTRPGKPVERARTKAVGSFGIKRVRYPDEKLMAYSCDIMARALTIAFLYQNYDVDAGYLNEPPKEGKDYNEYLKKENLRNWKLSDADLSLSVPILSPADRKSVPTIDQYWDEVSIDYDYRSAKEMGNPLTILDQYFLDRFKGERPEDAFREEKGVVGYYEAKTRDQVIKDSADAIVNKISDNLFMQWQQGVYSAFDVEQIAERILAMLNEKSKNLDGEGVDLDNEISALDKTLGDIFNDYKDAGVIRNLLGRTRENLFKEYADTLRAKYSAMTRQASLIFQRRLIPTLVQRFTALLSDIQKFLGIYQEYIEAYGELVGMNTPDELPDLRKADIECADMERLRKFIKQLLLDRPKMELMCQQMRDEIASNANKSFAKASVKMNVKDLNDISVKVLGEHIQKYHVDMCRDNPVLGLNVLEQLYQKYGASDDEIGRFANTLVANSEVYINLNEQEVLRNMRNTENPAATPAAGPNTIMVVSIPDLKTDKEYLQRFVETLKLKLTQAFNSTETRKFRIVESPRSNEMTIVTYQNIFPLRAISYMPFLKSKYEALVKTANETTNTTNKVVLHAEGDGAELPPLFGEGEGPQGDELIKYIFLAVAYGIIRQGEDDFGNKGWGLIEKDMFDAETFKLLSPSFTGIFSSQDLTPELIEDLVEKVDEQMNTPVHVNQKQAMAQAVKEAMKNHVLPEAGSPNNEVYKKYAAHAMDAMKVFM